MKKPITHTQNGYGFKDSTAVIIPHAGAPTDGASGTGVGYAGKGSLLLDTTNGDIYVNKGTSTTVDWRKATIEAS